MFGYDRTIAITPSFGGPHGIYPENELRSLRASANTARLRRINKSISTSCGTLSEAEFNQLPMMQTSSKTLQKKDSRARKPPPEAHAAPVLLHSAEAAAVMASTRSSTRNAGYITLQE